MTNVSENSKKNMSRRCVAAGLGATILLLATGCGADGGASAAGRATNAQSSVEAVLQEGIAGATVNASADAIVNASAEVDLPEEVAAVPEVSADEGISEQVALPGETEEPEEGVVDLTALSSTMVYSEVCNMMYFPENYVGKTIRMEGQTATFLDVETEKLYYACVIQDATACCAQGIEFVLTEDYAPDDYPADGDPVRVVGVFETYYEGEYQYCTLRDAVLE